MFEIRPCRANGIDPRKMTLIGICLHLLSSAFAAFLLKYVYRGTHLFFTGLQYVSRGSLPS